MKDLGPVSQQKVSDMQGVHYAGVFIKYGSFFRNFAGNLFKEVLFGIVSFVELLKEGDHEPYSEDQDILCEPGKGAETRNRLNERAFHTILSILILDIGTEDRCRSFRAI